MGRTLLCFRHGRIERIEVVYDSLSTDVIAVTTRQCCSLVFQSPLDHDCGEVVVLLDGLGKFQDRFVKACDDRRGVLMGQVPDCVQQAIGAELLTLGISPIRRTRRSPARSCRPV